MDLKPFQEKILHKIDRFNGRTLLALDMGLGKTAISLKYFDRQNERIIVICPASLRYNWLSESRKFKVKSKYLIINSLLEFEMYLKNNHVNFIMSYEFASKIAQKIFDNLKYFTGIVSDESHYIKNPKSKRTKMIVPLLRNVRKCLLLTGTPILNRPIELWSQLEAINTTKHGKYWAYAKRFCNAKPGKFGWDVSGSSNLKDLNYLLTSGCMIRELKSDHLPELGEKTRSKIEVEIKTNKITNVLEENIIEVLEKNNYNIEASYKDFIKRSNSKKCLFEAYSELANQKKELVLDIIENSLNFIERPIVILCHHKVMINFLKEKLEKKYTVGTITGDVSLLKRNEIVNNFQNNKITVLICAITVSVGLTLTASNEMYFAELPYNSGVALQAEDRIYRIGQNRSVSIRYIVASNSIDQSLWNLISEKQNLVSKILDSKPSYDIASSNVERKSLVYELIKFYYYKAKGNTSDGN